MVSLRKKGVSTSARKEPTGVAAMAAMVSAVALAGFFRVTLEKEVCGR